MHEKIPEVLFSRKAKLMQNLSSVYLVQHLYVFRANLQPIHTVYLLMMGYIYARNM